MEKYFHPDSRSAYEAIFEAQKIAFAPFVCQGTRALLKTGILKEIEQSKDEGISSDELAKKLDLPIYGVQVLLDLALSAKIVWQNKNSKKFILDKIGFFLLNDKMTKVNFNFSADVNYLPLNELTQAIQTGKPSGLSYFSENSETIYPLLQELPEESKKSWFEFDHYYSDISFDHIIKKIFTNNPKKIMDIGANTGKFSQCCLSYNDQVKMVLVDLPPQIKVANQNLTRLNLADRASFVEIDILKDKLPTFNDVDTVWMSQFLDCFSPDQIIHILKQIKNSVPKGTNIYINELFWDNQKQEAASFCLNTSSLYFTVLANGKSRFYSRTQFLEILKAAEIVLKDEFFQNTVGGHTLLLCQS